MAHRHAGDALDCMQRTGRVRIGMVCTGMQLSGAPLREPVALGGPIVMNTRDELRQAYRELQEGTFLAV